MLCARSQCLGAYVHKRLLVQPSRPLCVSIYIYIIIDMCMHIYAYIHHHIIAHIHADIYKCICVKVKMLKNGTGTRRHTNITLGHAPGHSPIHVVANARIDGLIDRLMD